MDALVDRYFATIPKAERVQVLSDVNVRVAEVLNVMGLYYYPNPYAISHRLQNVPINRGSKASMAWNAHAWDAASRGPGA